jgi:3-hydroxybutyryl-CoA dehydrogenase
VTTIRTVAVMGAGTMGHGIAQVCATAGLTTRLWDPDPASLSAALDRIESNLDKGARLGKIDPGARDAARRNLQRAPSLEEAAAGTDLVIEAAPESMELKRDLFERLDSTAPGHAILATNTSSLSIERIAEVVSTPERVVGLHFFNPVHLMRLLEVVRGPRTAPTVVTSVLEFAAAIGKEPILVADSPGFASSRLGIVLGLEAMRMVEQGVASVEDIDRAMVLGYNHPVGPLRLTDLVGLDVRLEIARYLHRELGGEQFRPPEILEEMVAEGKLGKKAGQGFYRWEEA